MLNYESHLNRQALAYDNRFSSKRIWRRRLRVIFGFLGALVLSVAAIAAYEIIHEFREMARVTLTVINRSDHDAREVHIVQQYPSQMNDILRIGAVAKGSQASETIHLSNEEGPCDVVVQLGSETYVGRTAPLLTDNGPFEYTAYIRNAGIHIEGSGSEHAGSFDLDRITQTTAATTRN
jgi:hypothetical protein